MIRTGAILFLFIVTASAVSRSSLVAGTAIVAGDNFGVATSGALNSNGTDSDVQTKLASATAGQTVTIPAGTYRWTNGVTATIAANVTLQGAGTSATGGGDQTVIFDDIQSDTELLNMQMSSNGVARVTGITFASGTGTLKDGGTINFEQQGTRGSLRIDHCRFVATNNANYKMVRFGTGVFGVMHECILDFEWTDALYFYNGRVEGGSDTAGNYEWSLPTDFGGTNYFVIEDNIIRGTNYPGGTVHGTRIFDGFTAAKVVVRFNDVSQACLSETHDTGHAPDDRGMRSQEVYGNLCTSTLNVDPNFDAVNIGGGTAVVWGNSWDNVYKNIYLTKTVRRTNDGGTYPQNATPTGWGYAGTEMSGVGSSWDGGTALGSDTAKGYPCLDQPGRGQGDLIRGLLPNKTNTTTGTIYWPNQALEPLYFWNNTGSIVSGWSGNLDANNSGGRVVVNRDYYLPASGIQTSATSPFDGTTNCGWGTMANRPTTCIPGVAYFATDQGSWNTSTTNKHGVQMSGADGVLYKATATNTWTAYYTPLTYPHPLRQ